MKISTTWIDLSLKAKVKFCYLQLKLVTLWCYWLYRSFNHSEVNNAMQRNQYVLRALHLILYQFHWVYTMKDSWWFFISCCGTCGQHCFLFYYRALLVWSAIISLRATDAIQECISLKMSKNNIFRQQNFERIVATRKYLFWSVLY